MIFRLLAITKFKTLPYFRRKDQTVWEFTYSLINQLPINMIRIYNMDIYLPPIHNRMVRNEL